MDTGECILEIETIVIRLLLVIPCPKPKQKELESLVVKSETRQTSLTGAQISEAGVHGEQTGDTH